MKLVGRCMLPAENTFPLAGLCGNVTTRRRPAVMHGASAAAQTLQCQVPACVQLSEHVSGM